MPDPRQIDTALRMAQGRGAAPTPAPQTTLARPSLLPTPAAEARQPAPAGMFLSPRVVDQRTFEELGAELRALAADADTRAAALRQALANSEKQLRTGEDSARQHRAAVEVLGKLLNALKGRTEEVEALIRRADERLNAASAAESSLAAAATSALADFDRRLEARIESALSSRAGQNLRTLVDDAERVKDELAHVSRRAEEQRSRADETEAAAHARCESLFAKVRDAEERAAAAASRITASANDIATGVDRLHALRHSADESAARADRSLAAALRATEELHGTLDRCGVVRETSAQAGVQLAAIVRRAESAAAELDRWENVLANANTPDALPPALENIVTTFRSDLAQDLTKMASAMSLIARRAETSVRLGQSGTPEIVIRTRESREAEAGA